MSTINALFGVWLAPLPFLGAGKKDGSKDGGTCNPAPSVVNNLDGDDSNWHKADGWSNGGMFNTGWRADHANINQGYLTLQLDNQACPRSCSGKPYASGEYRTNRFYGYGLYEVRFKAAKGDGLLSSFFTYTGKSDNNPHDEIDIEILGKNPRQMQINYFTGGKGHHEAMIDLGFDASADFHNYAISWEKDSISWFVDGKKVHTETGSRGPLPTHPGRIMANLWPGVGVDGWLNPFHYRGPVQAQYDWIKYTPTGACLPSAASPAEERIELYAPYLSQRPDPALGEEAADGRLKLDASKLEELFKNREITREQLKKILQAIADRPAIAALNPTFSFSSQADLFHYYPELKTIHTVYPRFDWYFIDFREYWGNAIILLSLYVQKCMEENRLNELPEALEMVNKMRGRMNIQQQVDQATNLPRMPYDYSQALLDITEAEIRAQTKNQSAEFYGRGIQLALNGLKELLSIENNSVFPFKPDYFTVTKNLLILGDLYQQVGHLETDENQKQKYYLLSYQLYQAVAGLGKPGIQSLSVSLDWLVDRLEIVINPAIVEEALAFNSDRGAIQPRDRIKANEAMFHYLPAIALIKQAGLFSSWPMPQPKTIDDLLAQIENIESGLTEIEASVRRSGGEVEKVAFFSFLGEMIEGELLLAVADRIIYYKDIPASETWSKLQKLPRVHSLLKQRLPAGKVVLDRRELSELITATVKEHHFSNLPSKFDYLSVWSKVKLLEIMLRDANFVIWANVGGERMKFGNPVEEIKFLRETQPLIEEISRGSLKADYLKIGFDYLSATLQLVGIPQKDARGNYLPFRDSTNEKSVKLTVFPDEVISLVENIESGIVTLPAAPRTYFGIYASLKEVGALLQCRERSVERNKRLLQRVTRDPAVLDYLAEKFNFKPKGTKDDRRKELKEKIIKSEDKGAVEKVLLHYALYLLGNIEKQVGSPLPPYLDYNLDKTLRQRIKQHRFHEVRNEMEPTKTFLHKVVIRRYPKSAKEILEKFGHLETSLKNRKMEESIKALDEFRSLLKKLDSSEKFADEYGEPLAWDLHSLRAELYHQTALVYSILKEGRILHQYVQSAYLECTLSSSNYDIKHRPYLLRKTRDYPDKKVPQLKALEERLFK